jgi:F-type H+-transporting ATPase subunit a
MGFIEVSIPAKEIVKLWGWPLTNTFILTFAIGLFIFLVFSIVLKRSRIVPGRVQNFLEWVLESIFNYIQTLTDDEEKTREIYPLSATLFILILFFNLLELMPGLGVFHFLRSPSSDLNLTIGLAVPSMFLVHLMAIRKIGPLNHLKKYIDLKSPLAFFVGILEGFSEITKIISLSVRLFGNLFAGEILLMVASGLFAYLLPLPFLLLEIMVGFVQALIFSSLIAIFYTVATEIH